MQLKEFDYHLPPELIAQHPLPQRDQARLLILNRQTRKIRHDIFANIGLYLPPESLLVLNDSKVIPARLFGHREKSEGKIEVFVLKCVSEKDNIFEVLLRPLKRLQVGEKIRLEGGLIAELMDKEKRLVRFNKSNVFKLLDKIGHMPLPPYITRSDEANDRKLYQTVFAKHFGSVASPTAGLHFTKPLLTQLQKAGHAVKKVTLHINYGTFKPVEEADITRHKMHAEEYQVTSAVWREIEKARKRKESVVAVGTTSCRVLESVAQTRNLKGSTDIFIYPGYKFKTIDALITNFHLPFSTLLMLVSAFGGGELIKQAYEEAIQKKYRFFSYGDGMLIV